MKTKTHKEKEQEILSICETVRKELEDLTFYAEHGFRDRNLGGWCAFSSWILFKILRRKGYRPRLCANWHHAFLMLDDKSLDVTITQFDSNFPKVWFDKPHKDHHQVNHHTTKEDQIWNGVVKGWCKPLPLDNEHIQHLLEI